MEQCSCQEHRTAASSMQSKGRQLCYLPCTCMMMGTAGGPPASRQVQQHQCSSRYPKTSMRGSKSDWHFCHLNSQVLRLPTTVGEQCAYTQHHGQTTLEYYWPAMTEAA